MHTVPPLFGAGDIVTVRQWEDMEAQYGIVPETGSIKVPCRFTTAMRNELCGRQFVVTKTYEIAEGWGYILGGVGWKISEEMLERPEEDIDLDTDKLFELFG